MLCLLIIIVLSHFFLLSLKFRIDMTNIILSVNNIGRGIINHYYTNINVSRYVCVWGGGGGRARPYG